MKKSNMLTTIAFDADDTLWHTEYYYRETEKQYLAMLAAYGVAPDEALDVLHRIEIDNLAFFGYGIRGFILSLIEAAIQVTGGQVRAADIQAIVDLGRGMTSHPIRLLEGAEEALTGLAGRRLLLITKGDVLDQESKIRRSGLAGYFQQVEIIIDKTPEAYAALLARHSITPGSFLMVGNSLRSDIAPVLALGGYAVHVPYPLTWAHESAVDLPADRSHFFEIASLRDLPALVEKIEDSA
jgi:putative hydrolase of the HAD superfamily